MDNKYGLGSTRVAHAHHEAKHGPAHFAPPCKYCGGMHLTLCPTMNDHFCKDCGRYQEDVPAGYSTGRNPDY